MLPLLLILRMRMLPGRVSGVGASCVCLLGCLHFRHPVEPLGRRSIHARLEASLAATTAVLSAACMVLRCCAGRVVAPAVVQAMLDAGLRVRRCRWHDGG
eukprot:365326-Chlamydomonas_euryale.AAC.10